MRIAITLLLMTATAHAGNHELTLGSSTRTLRSDSANALTADSLHGGSLGYGHHLDLAILPGLGMWAEGTFAWGGAEGRMFQTLSTELETLALTAGVRARYAIRSRIIASARLDLGMARAALAIRDDQGHSATDHGWGATSASTLGLDLIAINAPRFKLGLRAELGYVATSAVAMTATPDTDSEGTLQLEMTAAGLGSLDVSGAQFALKLVSEF